jgi:hypothetical protein
MAGVITGLFTLIAILAFCWLVYRLVGVSLDHAYRMMILRQNHERDMLPLRQEHERDMVTLRQDHERQVAPSHISLTLTSIAARFINREIEP